MGWIPTRICVPIARLCRFLRERPGLRIRKPATDSPKPNKIALPRPLLQKIDAVQLLLEERQSHR